MNSERTRTGLRTTWVLLATVWAGAAWGQVVTYEGDVFPEKVGWTVVPYCDPPRQLVDGCFEQQVSPCPNGGCQQEEIRRQLAALVGYDTFFLEWRSETTGPASEGIYVAPASMVIADDFANYHFTFARDQVRLIRSNLLPILFYPIAPESPHTFRLELYNAEPAYLLYIDGEKIEEGIAVAAFPASASAVISFRAKCKYEPSVTRWDFVRLGKIAPDGSFDYDGDGQSTFFDWYFMHDCLTKDGELHGGPWQAGPGSGPGCAFVDSDSDKDTDLFDFAEFQNLFGRSH